MVIINFPLLLNVKKITSLKKAGYFKTSFTRCPFPRGRSKKIAPVHIRSIVSDSFISLSRRNSLGRKD